MKNIFAKIVEFYIFIRDIIYKFLFSKTSEKVEIPEEEYKEPESEPDFDEIEQEDAPDIKEEIDYEESGTSNPSIKVEDYTNTNELEIAPGLEKEPEVEVPSNSEIIKPEVESPSIDEEENIPDWVDPDVFKEAIESDEEYIKTMSSKFENMNEEDMFFFFILCGTNYYGAAGLMGNLYAESALRSNNLQDYHSKKFGMSDEEYTTAVDNGTYHEFVEDKAGYGLAQWTYWTRKQNLLNFAVETNRSIGDCKMQCEFLIKELKSGYKSVWNTLCTATSVLEASNAVLLKFEKPADQSESVQNKRASFGQKYYDKYNVK